MEEILERSWPFPHPSRESTAGQIARVLTVHHCRCPRDGQGQEEGKEGQTPGQSRSRHHIHEWELGKEALEGGRRGESMSEHPAMSIPTQEAGWALPSPARQPQGLCTCWSLFPHMPWGILLRKAAHFQVSLYPGSSFDFCKAFSMA